MVLKRLKRLKKRGFRWNRYSLSVPLVVKGENLGSRDQRAESHQHRCPQWNHAVGRRNRERARWRCRVYFVSEVRESSLCGSWSNFGAQQQAQDVLLPAQRPARRACDVKTFLWVAPPTAVDERWRTVLSAKQTPNVESYLNGDT